MCADAEYIFIKFWKILLCHQYMLSQIDNMNARIYLFSVKRIEANCKIPLQ
jgi:hypothetical protein